MEGYGRWVALVLFSIWLIRAIYYDYKKDRWEVIYPLLMCLGGGIIVLFLFMIIEFW